MGKRITIPKLGCHPDTKIDANGLHFLCSCGFQQTIEHNEFPIKKSRVKQVLNDHWFQYN